MLGNHAVVRGALESGVGFASTYPGTPASEVGDTFAQLAKEAGIYFEYSTNEKVATEAAAAAAAGGVRSIVSFKHFGFNVASDSIYPIAWFGVKAGMVIVVADDPDCHSSGQSEQDSRYLARIAHMPLLEPADAQECKDFTKIGFRLSEKIGTPVILRLVTRVSHSASPVKVGKILRPRLKGSFPKDKAWNNMPPKIIDRHARLHKSIRGALKESRNLNFIIKGKGKIGVISSGVSHLHLLEALGILKLKLPILKLGLVWPLDEKIISNFIKDLKAVFVAEEIEDVIAKDIKEIAKDTNPKLRVISRSSKAGETGPTEFAKEIGKLTGKSFRTRTKIPKVPKRPPVLCPGCPHRATFWAAKTTVPNAVFGGDIGCYIIGIYPPMETQHFIISMGADQGFCHGISKTTNQKVIAFIGDSTFFHAGIPGLINSVYNKSNYLTIALDNRTTAMTGQQPHPGTGITGMGEETKALKIEDIARACGVDHIRVVNPFNVKETKSAIKELMGKSGTKLLVAKGECRLKFMRRARREGIKVPVFQINQDKCKKCGVCLLEFGCPAIYKEKGNYYIDEEFCWGCGVCAQVCPYKAITVKK